MLELSRIITSLGAVVASTALIIYGVVVSYVAPDTAEATASLWAMVIGAIMTAVGLMMYRSAYQEED